MTTKLTPKQEAFVREYLVDLCAAHAAVRAGYSERSAKQTGCDLLAVPKVQAAIAKAQAERAERVDDDADQVLRDLRRLGKKAEQLGEFAAALKAVELRGKHLGMWKERLEHTGPNGEPLETVTRVELVALTPQ